MRANPCLAVACEDGGVLARLDPLDVREVNCKGHKPAGTGTYNAKAALLQRTAAVRQLLATG